MRTWDTSTTTIGDRAAACEQFKKALEIYLANVKCKRLPKKHPYIAQAQVWLKRAQCRGNAAKKDAGGLATAGVTLSRGNRLRG